MSSDFQEWWKKFLSQDRAGLMRLAVVGVLGVGLVTFGSFGMSVPSPPSHSRGVARTPLVAQESEVGQQLTTILRKIPGVRKISVAVTLKRSIQSQIAQQSSGGQSANAPVLVTTSSGQNVVPLDQIGPLVAGVVVVSPNATNPNIRAELSQAVQTLLQVQAYQVLVLPN